MNPSTHVGVTLAIHYTFGFVVGVLCVTICAKTLLWCWFSIQRTVARNSTWQAVSRQSEQPPKPTPPCPMCHRQG